MSSTSCPRCAKQVTLPEGASASAQVRCPLCHAQYALADALANLPPRLQLVEAIFPGDAPELPLMGEQRAAAEVDEMEIDDLLAGMGDSETVEPALGGQVAPVVAEPASDTDDMAEPLEFEEAMHTGPASDGEEASADKEEANVDDNDFLSFEDAEAPASSAPSEEINDAMDTTPYVSEGEAVLDFGEALVEPSHEGSSEAAAEDELGIDFAAMEEQPADEHHAAAHDDLGLQQGEGLNFAQGEATADAGYDIDFGEAEPVAAGEAEEALNFGEPQPAAGAESELAAPPAKGKKQKKEKKEKAKQPREPKPARKRSLASVALNMVLPGLLALVVTYYVGMWISPGYDLVGIGPKLPGWMAPPGFKARGTQVAQAPATQPNFPPVGAVAGAEPTTGAQPADTPAAAPPADSAVTTPESPVETPPVESSPPESPAATPAAPVDATPAPMPPVSEPAVAESAPSEPATESPSAPVEPATVDDESAQPADEPAQPAEKPEEGDALEGLLDSDSPKDSPEEMPAEEMPADAADVSAPAEPAADAADMPEESADAAAKPDEPAAEEGRDPFEEAAAAAEPAATPPEEPAAAEEAAPEAPPAEAVGPRGAAPVSVEQAAKALADASRATEKMSAAQAAKDDAEIKKARKDFYLSWYALADAVTNGSDAATQDSARQMALELATDAKRLDALKFNAARWLGYGKRTTSGVVVAGEVQSSERDGALYHVKLQLTADAPPVTIVTAKDPQLSPQEEVLAFGSIVERPAEALAGYRGDEESVVWCTMIDKLPASK